MPRSPDFKYTRSIPDLIASQRKPMTIPETGWYRVSITENFEGSSAGGQYAGGTEAVFKNSWADAGVVAGVTNAPASWYLSENGEVRLRGKITGGAVNTTVFKLPQEVRPEYAETFIVSYDDDGNIDLSGIKFRAHETGDV